MPSLPRRRAPIVFVVATSIAIGCRGPAEDVRPAPEDVKARADVAIPAPGPACLRLSSCGQWGGCVLARPQALPFAIRAGETPVTAGRWYRFDVPDRPNEAGMLAAIYCAGDAGPCFEGLQHVIPCLPYFNPVAPDYRCELIGGACTILKEPAKAR